MSYKSWFEQHAKKHKKIIDKLQDMSDAKIIEYFRFENMVKKELDFCPLYKDNKKCHDLKELNCYMCACPNFRLTDTKSYCSIDSKDGGTIVDKTGFIHQNCTQCTVPHKEKFIKDNFDRDWAKMMKDVM